MAVLLHHDVTGPADAPVLVLSGSVGSTIEMWEPNLAALSRTFRVVRLDHRGHGGSAVPPGPYRITDLAGDAVATLDALGIETFAWCGLSMGAMVGMAVAADHPQRVASLVLCCTSAHLADPSVWRERAEAVTRGGTAPLAPGIVRRWFTPRWAQEHPAEVDRAVRWVSGTSDEGYRACCQAIMEWDHRSRLREITAPTLVIAGEHDVATPVDPDARTLVEAIPDARLEVLDAAHVATVEAPAEASRLIRTHVAG
jgi:3-oxoadipate enol-lactonase